MAEKSKPVNNPTLDQLEETLDGYLVKKAPFQIPPNVKEIFVKFAPWITIIQIILTVGVLLPLLGLGALLAPFGFLGGVNSGFSYGYFVIVSLVESVAVLILMALAVQGLFHQSRRSWYLLFYAELVTIVANLLTLNLIGAVVGGLITFYILFQIKSYYK